MDQPIETLLKEARAAMMNAHAPYSHFRVGAALRTRSGNFFSGCNVENASYGLTICAERNAIFKMVGSGEREIAELLVISDSEDFLPPCGGCRQVMAEFAQGNTIVYMGNQAGNYKKTTLAELLPFVFVLKQPTVHKE